MLYAIPGVNQHGIGAWTNAESSECSLSPKKNDATFALYNAEAVQFIRRFYAAGTRDDLADMGYEELSVAAVEWFLEQHARWTRAYIRRQAAALTQWIELCSVQCLIPDHVSRALFEALQNKLPRPAQKRTRKGFAKSIKAYDLRRLIVFFRSKDDEFSWWIASYLQIASRIGWRPGEVIALCREEKFLRATAEKRSNGRGLCDICEVIIASYPDGLIQKLDAWIADASRWRGIYGGNEKLRAVMLGRIMRACVKLKIRPINLYTLRHHAIASMKKSGFSPKEIAVLINHASSRTSVERYGKARTGIRRAKKLLGYSAERLALVRDNARKFSFSKEKSLKR